MKNPFRRDEFIPSTPKKGGCALFLVVMMGLGGLVTYGATEFLGHAL